MRKLTRPETFLWFGSTPMQGLATETENWEKQAVKYGWIFTVFTVVLCRHKQQSISVLALKYLSFDSSSPKDALAANVSYVTAHIVFSFKAL